jgi:hypothetical protein
MMKEKIKVGDRVQLIRTQNGIMELLSEEESPYEIIVSRIILTSDHLPTLYECIVKMPHRESVQYMWEDNIIKYDIETEQKIKNQFWIGVELDGTLAEFHGWKGHNHIGKPIPETVTRVKDWTALGHTIKIFTARVSPQQGQYNVDIALRTITHWCFKHIGMQLPVTCSIDFDMTDLWSCHCVQFIPNIGSPIRNNDIIKSTPEDTRILWECAAPPKFTINKNRKDQTNESQNN